MLYDKPIEQNTWLEQTEKNKKTKTLPLKYFT